MALLCRLVTPLLAGLLLCLNAQAQDCPPPPQQPTQAELTQLASHAQDRGFLWAINKGGVTSYLYGTLHVQKLDWLVPGPRLRKAMQSAKMLALELDLSDPDVLNQIRTPPAEDADRSFVISTSLRARLYARMKAECVDPPTASASQTSQAQEPQQSLTTQLAVLDLLQARRDGLEAAFGSEMMLASLAHAQDKPIHSLETVSEQLHALEPRSQAEFTALFKQGLDDLDSGKARRVMNRMATAWSTNNADTLLHYKDWCECVETDADRAQLKRVFDDRNLLLAARIDALHAQHGPLLVGIGALHMFGPAGLPNLLRKRGFKVTRVF